MISPLLDLKDDLSNAALIVMKYDDLLDGYENILTLEGKLLRTANSEQAEALMRFTKGKIETQSILKRIQIKKEQIKGSLWKKLTSFDNGDLNYRDKEQFINNEKEYIDWRKIEVEAAEIYEKYSALVDAFNQRGYSLKNLTEIAVNSLDNYTI